jgi:hypothetical protein
VIHAALPWASCLVPLQPGEGDQRLYQVARLPAGEPRRRQRTYENAGQGHSDLPLLLPLEGYAALQHFGEAR